MSDQNKTVLITGASAGIGKSFAEVFFKNGFNLVLTARRTDRLEAIKANLLQTSKNQEIHIISADLSNEVAPREIFNFCKEQNIHIVVQRHLIVAHQKNLVKNLKQEKKDSRYENYEITT